MIDQFNFDAFNESKYFVTHVEAYKKLYGFYPKVVQTDAIKELSMTRENRQYLKEHGIRHTGRPLGRKPKIELTPYQ